jgi:hypothetical protein
MLHLATYIMMPFMADLAFGAPTPNPSTTPVPFVPQNTTSIPPPQEESSGTAGNQTLINLLSTAATAVDRIALLPNAADHVYDFNNPPIASAMTTGDGGHTVKADRKDFPALIGNGVSMTVGFIGPCGFNSPHTHPRSAEINIVVQGELGTEYVLENGASLIRNRLTQYQMTVFPQGAIHTEWNPDCTDAVFVAGFASEDPGVQQSAQRVFDLDDDVLEAMFANDFTFNGADIDTFRSLIPANVANGVESCLAKCGIAKR